MSDEVSEEISYPSSRFKNKARNKPTGRGQEKRELRLVFDPENGGDMFLRNEGRLSSDYRALYKIRGLEL
jgi:hypothetical protein